MKVKKNDLGVDALVFQSGGRIHGSGNVAQRLMANGMSANGLRTNSTLRKDEWKLMDEKVVKVSRQRLVGVGDLISRGLVYNIPNGLGVTVLETETEGDMSAAEINMTGSAKSDADALTFDIGYLPLPITHKGFPISIRKLEASRKLGQPLDVSQVGIASRKVAEKIETILFQGAGTYTFGGGTLYGYVDHPLINTATLGTNWDVSAGHPGSDIVGQVREMKQKSITAKHHGPWILYVPGNYETVMDNDYSTSYPNVTIRDRIKKIEGIEDVKVADYLADDKVLLVELQEDTVRMVIGLQPTTVEWESEGGMVFHFKVMAIMVPQIRADKNDKCGITLLS